MKHWGLVGPFMSLTKPSTIKTLLRLAAWLEIAVRWQMTKRARSSREKLFEVRGWLSDWQITPDSKWIWIVAQIFHVNEQVRPRTLDFRLDPDWKQTRLVFVSRCRPLQKLFIKLIRYALIHFTLINDSARGFSSLGFLLHVAELCRLRASRGN